MSKFETLALAAQITSCLMMAGVVVIVQFIHYPAFALIDRNFFSEFHRQHTSALGFIAGPLMCIELASALWLAKNGNFWLSVNALAVILLWQQTFFVSVPAHEKLSKGFDEDAWKKLLKSNWLRTALWLGRSLVFSVWIFFLLN